MSEPSPNNIAPQALDNQRVLVLGDSFVTGAGASDQGWAQQLVEVLHPAAEIRVSGVAGNTSGHLLARCREHAEFDPGTLIVQIGINDSRYRPSKSAIEMTLERFRYNVTATTRTYEAHDVFLLGLTRVDEAHTAPLKDDKHYRNADIELYDAALREVAHDINARYLALPPLNDSPRLLADGLHPSALGYHAILKVVLAGLRDRF